MTTLMLSMSINGNWIKLNLTKIIHLSFNTRVLPSPQVK